MRPKNFEITVSWGHIAGVAWGEPLGFPVLCLHGIQDNAGTFGRLIPLLPKRFYWVAIDLPGHGLSSHFEGGHPIEYTHLIYAVKIVVDHFKWTKLILMGHSLGAQLSSFFSSIYPEFIVKTILIDGIVPSVTDEEKYIKALRKKFDDYHRLETSLLGKTPPSYTLEAAINRLITNRPNFILPEAAKVLIKRSLAASGDGFRYSTDQRYKLMPMAILSFPQVANIIQKMEGPCLFIIAEESLKNVRRGDNARFYSEEYVNALESLPNFTVKMIPGHHDVHLNDPDGVAALIVPFLKDTQSLL